MNYRLGIITTFIIISGIMQGQTLEYEKEIINLENLTIFSDRDVYISGDVLFFSVKYGITKTENRIITSKVIYVELINLNQEIQPIQKKYRIINGSINGHIVLNDQLPSGIYMLRAYTQYQRNFSDRNFACNYITILNPKQKDSPVYKNPNSFLIVPESNLLIGNLKNQVVIEIPPKYTEGYTFYLSDNNGQSKKIEHKNINENLIQLDTVFYFNTQYFLNVYKDSGGLEIQLPFPKIQNSGIQTNTTFNSGFLAYSMIRRMPEIKNTNYKICLFSNRFQQLFDKHIVIDDTAIQINFPLSDFKKGINYIVLYNDKDSIIKINSVYIPQLIHKPIDIKIEKDTFATCEKLEFVLDFKNENETIFPLLTASVIIDKSRNENNNFSSLYLFQDPDILDKYLNKISIKNPLQIKRILTLYDKFVEKESFITPNSVTDTFFLEYLPDISEILISGRLTDKNSGLPLTNQNVYLSVLSSDPELHINTTDNEGEFIFPINELYGLNTLILSTDIENSNYKIKVNNPFEPFINQNKRYYYIIDEKLMNSYQEMYINTQITREFHLDFNYSNSDTCLSKRFNIKDNDKIIYLKNYVGFSGLEELINELFPSLSIRKNNKEYSIIVYDDNGSQLPGKPIILLDYIPIFNINDIIKLDISKIVSVEVINKQYVLGNHILQGVIILRSNTDNFTGIEFPKSAELIEYYGIEENEIKYYEEDELIPDFKSTLYWNPSITLTEGMQGIDIKTSDRKGIYNIIIEGIDNQGNIYFGIKQFIVD